MDIDRGFVAALLREGYEVMDKRGIRPEMLEGAGKAAFDFIDGYWRRHGRMPSLMVILEQTGVDLAGQPKEPASFWADEVFGRFLYGGLQKNLDSVLGHMEQAHPRDALEAWKAGFFNLQSLVRDSSGGVEPIFGDTDSIMAEHDRAKLGITGIPSPYPTLNEATQGWQPEELVVLAGRPGQGKSLNPKTKVIKADGTISEAQEIKPGDHLMGPDGKPRLVRGVHRGREEMFEVIPIKGERWQCNRSHILSLKCSTNVNLQFRKGQIYNLTIDELLALPSRVQAKLKLWRTGFDLPDHAVEMDPYLVGVWLGDGDHLSPKISNPEPEIAEYLRQECQANGWWLEERVDVQSGCPRLSVSMAKPFHRMIDEATADGQKRIPRRYLINGREKRLQLLAGLLDTDGYLNDENAGYEIITKYEGLRDDILFLARSLGYAANWKNKIGTIKSLGFSGLYYRIRISGHLDRIPLKVVRKKAKPRNQIKDVLVTGFSLKSVGDGDYFGFDLAGDHLYLLWDTTVTHNTNLLIIMAVHAWLHGNKILFVSTEMSKTSIKRRFAAFVCKISYGRLRKGKLREVEEQQLREKLKELEKDTNLLMLGADMNPTIEEVESQCLLHQPKMICLDGYYLMRSSALANVRNRSERVAEMLDITKCMLKRLKVPALLTTQMNRPPQQRQGGAPTKPDLDRLAFSDNMGMLADYVFFLDRNEEMRHENLMKLMPIKMRESDFIKDLYLNWDFEKHDFTESNRDFDEETRVTKAAKPARGRGYKDEDDNHPLNREDDVGAKPW